ncbi:MAG: glutamine synthetase type III [Ruminococcaceae bacterium]|nr:glutamine synthetase type III [Oscillospiraceae bacterium]
MYNTPNANSDSGTEIFESFGCDVFNEAPMKKILDPHIFCLWQESVKHRKSLPPSIAEPMAEAMKHWALSRGATHYSHWFQPLTGITAEKHESFLDIGADGKPMLSFSGTALIRSESDASSFPNGGLRATFEARGYTAWDPSAYAFVKDGCLYIPTCFFSPSGAALDKKTPLLRSIEEVSREAVRVLRLFGDKETTQVTPFVGAEQEYFLVDKADYLRRPDLLLTGRTLFGALPPKGQELDDHYYGVIRPRILRYMRELDSALWRLGIPAKTRHNEVAPCQHELAPIYSTVNAACDHNQLMMELMKKTAEKHGLVCLLHEKPFAGINGSGKHNNWSLATDGGTNLFTPGKSPMENGRFLLFLAAFIKGADEYQDYLRCTAASAGNDLRLGGNEAPPAIVSVFLGQELSAVVQTLIDGIEGNCSMTIGIDPLPAVPGDTTDRNRTSPLAFTGNKFEFRMLGASQSISDVNIALNTIMAHELKWFADRLESSGDFISDLHRLIAQTFFEHRRILFSGNGYDDHWKIEATRRGLSNHQCTADCLQTYVDPAVVSLLTGHGIFSPEEFRARREIHRENYGKIIRIEALTMISIIRSQILPAVGRYCGRICSQLREKQALSLPCQWEERLSARLSALSDKLDGECIQLEQLLSEVPEHPKAKAFYYRLKVLPAMEVARGTIDHLEAITEKSSWPFPAYSDLLFFA